MRNRAHIDHFLRPKINNKTFRSGSNVSNKWEGKYPLVIKSWTKNWEELSAYYKYPPAIRKVIYTTNAIESFHSQLRKITKTKRVFTSDMALLKLLYLVQREVTKK